VAFFHAIPGLECALKLHYRDEEAYLSDLLRRAVEEKVVLDRAFADPHPFTDWFYQAYQKLIKEHCATNAELLAHLIPELRNQYFHGIYLLAPDYLHLTFQLREFADALMTRRGIQA
jgi:hypothetical protein